MKLMTTSRAKRKTEFDKDFGMIVDGITGICPDFKDILKDVFERAYEQGWEDNQSNHERRINTVVKNRQSILMNSHHRSGFDLALSLIKKQQ